ncbi:MAG: ABC transporter permease [Burkholderiaceae bacterium]
MDLILAQWMTGLAHASTLFLVASGLTLIFGVTRVVNFAHGSLYMLGAYLGYTLASLAPATVAGFFGALLAAALVVAAIGVVIETTVLRRVYGSPEIFQLLATWGVVLVVQDLALSIWGPQELFAPRAPGFKGAIEIAGAYVPSYTLLLMAVGPLVALALTWLMQRTRWGVTVRACTQDREMAGALGINEPLVFTSVFALGAGLAGLAGALQIPRETVNLQMDLTIVVEAFVVVVVGGLGSIAGAFWAALGIGILHALGTWWLPQSTLVLVFVAMGAVLVLRPYGLLGRPEVLQHAGSAAAPLPFGPTSGLQRGLMAVLALMAAVAPAVLGDYAQVLATEFAIAALLAASLHVFMSHAGIVSFGHAAFFGAGAYAAALLFKHGGASFAANLLAAPLLAAALAVAAGLVILRASGVYAAMLSLALAQILWSGAVQWVGLTGGDNGILGVWPPFESKLVYYWLTLAIVLGSLFVLRRLALSPAGFAVRAGRDAPERAAAIGIDSRRLRLAAFVAGGLFAGLAGVLQAYFKGSVFPTTLAIPVSVDALVMVLLGGLNTLSGPVVGAVVYQGLLTEVVRLTEHWRLLLGLSIIAMVVLFPQGLVGWWRQRQWGGNES